jgi:hypothetical protein
MSLAATICIFLAGAAAAALVALWAWLDAAYRREYCACPHECPVCDLKEPLP